MSDHHIGPFRRPGNHPYQLPPPRGSEPLQFGADPFLRQRDPARDGDSGTIPDQTRPRQQLPSVSQLLTNTPRSSPPPYPPASGPAASVAPRQPSRLLYHDDRPPFPTAVYGRPPLSQAEDLPPISHAIHSSGETPSPPCHSTGTSPLVPSRPGYPVHHGTITSSGRTSPPETPAGAAGEIQNQPHPVRPHVVDEKHIEGEGLCYIYADGSYCPKIIDGVPVNANWGVTKAGKPRKRLAQACLTCREKKIKCHPNLPKCDQCQKSGRHCRFENAPRGNRAALRTPQFAGRYDAKDSYSGGYYYPPGSLSSPYPVVHVSDSCTSLPGTSGQSPTSEGSMLTPSVGDSAQESSNDAEQSNRARMQGLNIAAGVEDPFKRPVASVGPHLSPRYAELLMEMQETYSEDSLTADWNRDPYALDPDTTMHYIDSYFTNINDNLYHMLPRRCFLLWLQSRQSKTPDDKMLLYSMLAMGTVFSDRPDRLVAMKRYSRTARYAVERSRSSLSLQLAQSRIIMSQWYYAIGALVQSWDSVGAAVRVVCGLRYNMESGGVMVEDEVCEYGLHPQALMECRRRTFWVAYLMDRLSSFYSQSSTFIPSQTAFLHLPCREEIFEAQQYATVPYFQSFLNKHTLSEDDLAAVSPMTFFIEIVSLWGEVVHHVFRLPHIPAESYSEIFDEFYIALMRRLEEWAAKLPSSLIFTVGNLERSVRWRNADSFISVHLLYHAALMKLNRHARYRNFHPMTINQYIHRARHHAVEILRISAALVHYSSEYDPVRPGEPSPTMILNPSLGYVIVSAVDVLSAIGLMTDLSECINLIRTGLDTVRELGRFWDSSIFLSSLIETRMTSMAESLRYRPRLEGKVVFAVDSPSLDSQVSTSMLKDRPSSLLADDLLYGLPRNRLFNALGLEDPSFSEQHILSIQD